MTGFRLEPRAHCPWWLNLLLPLAAVGAALVLCSGLVVLAGADVLDAYSKLFLSSLSTAFNLVETVVKAAPLVFTGLAVTVAFRAKFWNIGAEGQLLAGAMAAAFIGAREGLPAWSLVPLMIAGGALAGSAWALLPAVLKTRCKVDDVVTTLLLNFVIFYGMMALLDGPWKDPLSGYPDSPDIRAEAEFPILLRATRLHLGVLLAALATAAVWLMLRHTTLGFEIDAVGEKPNAARYAGINLAAVTLLTAGCLRRARRARRRGGSGRHPLPGHGRPVSGLRLHRHRHRHARAPEPHRGGAGGDIFRDHHHRRRSHVAGDRRPGVPGRRHPGHVPDHHAGGPDADPIPHPLESTRT